MKLQKRSCDRYAVNKHNSKNRLNDTKIAENTPKFTRLDFWQNTDKR